MVPALGLVLLLGLLALEPSGMDPAVVKLPLLAGGTGVLLAASAVRRRRLQVRTFDLALLALALWLLLCSALAEWPGRHPEALLGMALAGSWYWLARRELHLREHARLLAGLSLVCAVGMLLELVVRPPWMPVVGAAWRAEELVGPLANPNLGASAVLLGAPSATLLWGWPAALVCAGALAGSLGRAAWLGGLVGAGLWAWRRGRPAPRALALVLFAGAVVLGFGAWRGKLRPAALTESRTVRARLDMLDIFSAAAGRAPWAGWGPGRAGVAFSLETGRRGRPDTLPDRVEFAHNPLLQRTVEGGVPALLLTLWLAWLLLGRIREQLDGDHPGPALGLAAFLVAELVSIGLETPWLHLLTSATIGALMTGSPEGEDAAEGRSPLAGLLALLLLAGTPAAWNLSRAEPERTRIRETGDGAILQPEQDDLCDRFPSPELRYDAAGVLALSRRLDLARARWLVLESGYPNYGSSRANRQGVREYQLGSAVPVQGPAPPPGP